MSKLLVYFRAPEDFIAQLGSISKDFEIIACKKREELKDHLPEAVILITLFAWPDSEMIRHASKLRWIQALTAGVDFLPLDEIRERNIILTNGRGIHKIGMAEYAIAGMINLAHNFHLMFSNQSKGKWERSVPQNEIYGSTVGILGLGSIGQEIARKASMMGMHVIGVKSNPHPVEGVDQVYGPEKLAEIFERSDYIINLLPATPQTKGLIDKKYF